jgi:hypothetical protein
MAVYARCRVRQGSKQKQQGRELAGGGALGVPAP